MNVLLTGASSLLGWEILRQAPSGWTIFAGLHRNIELPASAHGCQRLPLDLTDRKHVQQTLQGLHIDAVIHAASVGNLDSCQKEPAAARLVNVEGTRNLLEYSTRDCAFVFASTLYVFDGTNPPYDETMQPHPINEYATMKLEAERLVQTLSPRPIIVRPMTMYGWHAPDQRMNWVTWLLNKLRNEEQVSVVNDVYNNHLWAGDCARGVIAAVLQNVTGVLHFGGPEMASRYDFSVKVAEAFGFDRSLIVPVTSSSFPDIALRPPNTSCSITKMRELLGVQPLGIEAGLARMKSEEPVPIVSAALANAAL
jgi:dTDP-4-dehydrorhamnose reductase